MGFRDFWPSRLRLWGDTPGVSSQRFKIDSGDGHGDRGYGDASSDTGAQEAHMNTGKLAIGAALTLAVVMVSSSTTVLAMTVLPKHSVGQQQLKTGAVTTKKIHKHAVTGSQVAANTFVPTTRMRFGKGFATSEPATTVLKLPRVNAVVTTDGTASEDPNVVVRLPRTPGVSGWVFQVDGDTTFSTGGGKPVLAAPSPGNELSVTISQFDEPAEFYLHCTFDQRGSHPNGH